MSNDVLTLHELTAGAFCYIRAADGRFLTFTQEAGFHLSSASRRTYFEIVKTDDHKLLFRCAHGLYLSANPDCSMSSARAPAAWETFTVHITDESELCLQSFHGDYMYALSRDDSITFSKLPPTPDSNVAILNAFTPEEYDSALQRATPAEKVVWTFWDTGYEAMYPFYKLNVKTWRHVLGPEWHIHLLNIVKGDDGNVFNFIDASQLPLSFSELPTVVKSDAVRLALLDTYGGVWMDVGIVLLKSLDEICWDEMQRPEQCTLLGGFFNSGWGSEHLDRRDAFENWFIAARGRNAFIEQWRRIFVEYWNDRIESIRIWADPLFESLDLSNFERYGMDFRNYLTSHVAFRKVLETHPHMKKIWKHNTRLYDAGEGAFLLTTLVGWQASDIHRALVAECHEDLLERLLRTPLMKFTSGMLLHIRNLSEEVLLDDRSTMGKLYRRILELGS